MNGPVNTYKRRSRISSGIGYGVWRREIRLHTSANVKRLEPPKNGAALERRGSISFTIASVYFAISASCSAPEADTAGWTLG